MERRRVWCRCASGSPREARVIVRARDKLVWRVRALTLVGLAACTLDIPAAVESTCPTTPLGPGETYASSVACSSMLFANGDGDSPDLFIGNELYRAVLRHPQASLSLAGLGGVTLVDAAAWGRADFVYEIAPLVGGGWLDVDHLEFVEDGIQVSGLVRALPAHDATAAGDRRTVTWRTEAGNPWLNVEGAEGFWIATNTAATRVDGWLMADPAVIGHGGHVVEDLGGAIVVEGTSSLLFSDTARAWALRPTDHQHISGNALGAAAVDLLKGDALVGRVPVAEDGTYDATIDAAVDGLRAVIAGRASSPIVAPGEAVELTLGAVAAITLQPVWPADVRVRPVGVSWRAADGRSGLTRMEPDGARIATGAGVIDLTLSAGPAWTTKTLRADLFAGDEQTLQVAMIPAMATTGTRVLTSLGWEGGRARTQGVSESDRSRAAVVAGYEFAVITALDDVATTGAYLNDAPWIRTTPGATLTSPDGWKIGAWPWGEDSGRSGHAAPRVRDLSPGAAFNLAWGGPSIDRYTIVDLNVLGALDAAPWSIEATPSFVALDAPGGPPFDAWAPWFRWLDAGRFVRPSGPDLWLDVGTPKRYGVVEITRAINVGELGCGNGAWLNLRVDGVVPGSLVPKPKPDTDGDTDSAPTGPVTHTLVIDLHAGESSINRVSIVTQGKGVLGTFTPGQADYRWTADLELGDWTTAIAWSTTSNDWATVTPVWTRSPAALPAQDTDATQDTP